MSDAKTIEPKITSADFWRIWVQLHFPGDVRLMSEPEIFAASFMIPGARPTKLDVDAWVDMMKTEVFAGRTDMFSPTEAEIAQSNAEILKKAGIKLKSTEAPLSSEELVSPVVKE